MFGRNKVDRSFRIESEIGSGGSGAVYKAWHTRMCKYVVVKEHKHNAGSDAETRRNELEALKNVKCVYLPQVFDYITKGKRSFTVMEYIEGESFDKLLARGKKFTGSQMIEWYSQLALALESLHRQDVCHRDIKPANIMLTSNGDVCLIDFNAALVKGSKMRFTSRSLGYASPEQCEIYENLENARNTADEHTCGETAVCQRYAAETQLIDEDSATLTIDDDSPLTGLPTEYRAVNVNQPGAVPVSNCIDWKLSDIFSLGATMYHLLTGKRPPNRPVESLAIGENSGYKVDLVYIIEKSMQFNPSDRLASASVLSDIIRQVKEFDAVNTLINVGQEFAPVLHSVTSIQR